MNPNVMAPTAPKKVVQDVMPPHTAVNTQTSATSLQPAAEPVPIAEEAPRPMFPVEAVRTAVAANPPAQPVAEHPALPIGQNKPKPAAQAQPHQAYKFNWLVIGLAILVTAGLGVAAYMAMKSSS